MVRPETTPATPLPRAFGRKCGRPLGLERSQILADKLPSILIAEDFLHQDGCLRPETLFAAPCAAYWLEVGFGQGEHLAARIEQNPQAGFLGAEPFINGVAGFLQKIEGLKDPNIRILKNDALILARSLSKESLDGLYILNPDPWHKKRHHKRRIIRPETVPEWHRILKPGGVMILSTDVPEMAEWMLLHTLRHGGFDWLAQSAKDWQTPPAGWIETRFEGKKAKGARAMTYLVFKKTLAYP